MIAVLWGVLAVCSVLSDQFKSVGRLGRFLLTGSAAVYMLTFVVKFSTLLWLGRVDFSFPQ